MANIAGSKIKNLQVLITKLNSDISYLKSQQDEILSQITLKQSQINKYQKEIDLLQKNSDDIIISEHALLRYLQRVYKLDITKIEHEIIDQKTKQKIKQCGNGKYKVENDFYIKVQDNVVVTVLEK